VGTRWVEIGRNCAKNPISLFCLFFNFRTPPPPQKYHRLPSALSFSRHNSFLNLVLWDTNIYKEKEDKLHSSWRTRTTTCRWYTPGRFYSSRWRWKVRALLMYSIYVNGTLDDDESLFFRVQIRFFFWLCEIFSSKREGLARRRETKRASALLSISSSSSSSSEETDDDDDARSSFFLVVVLYTYRARRTRHSNSIPPFKKKRRDSPRKVTYKSPP